MTIYEVLSDNLTEDGTSSLRIYIREEANRGKAQITFFVYSPPSPLMTALLSRLTVLTKLYRHIFHIYS